MTEQGLPTREASVRADWRHNAQQRTLALTITVPDEWFESLTPGTFDAKLDELMKEAAGVFKRFHDYHQGNR
jgi:hypothetical protein